MRSRQKGCMSLIGFITHTRTRTDALDLFISGHSNHTSGFTVSMKWPWQRYCRFLWSSGAMSCWPRLALCFQWPNTFPTHKLGNEYAVFSLSPFSENNEAAGSHDAWMARSFFPHREKPAHYSLSGHERLDIHAHTHTHTLTSPRADLAAHTICLEWLTFPSITGLSIIQTHIYKAGTRRFSHALSESINKFMK